MQLLSRRGRAVSFGPLVVAAAVGLLSPGAAHAQTADGVEEETPSDEATEATDEQTERRSRGGADAATENIVITGTKKARREFASDAPVAVSAFSDEKLEAMQFRDIESLSFSIPNVSLDSVGTAKGVANFSIRGLGANSSIPTIDPTVGLFVNGVYFGTNAGAVLDSFDLEAVEVLRGPQGILFGRNVTGGAVLMRTKRPGDTYGASIKANVETGLESRIYGAVDLPVLPDLLKFRVAGQFRNDDGWFTNLRNLDDPDDDTQFGAEQTWLVRPTVSFTPGPLTVHVMYERGQTEAQGPPAQSTMDPSGTPGPFTGFDFSIDEEGVANYFWNHLFVEAILDLGDAGQIVDIFGFRTVLGEAISDIDAQPISLFHADTLTDVQHISNELRYSGSWFNNLLEPTIGVYVFQQTIQYRERRLLLGVAVPDDPTAGALDSTYGGDQDQLSLGAFTQWDINLTDAFTIIAGARVTYEEKTADVATFTAGDPNLGPCPTLRTGFDGYNLDCSAGFTFTDTEDWVNFSPKLGLKWAFAKNNQIYGHYTRGFRGGGYNLRNTSADPAAVPGPFGEEQQDAFELGLKGSILNNRVRFNLAGFVNLMSDLQREVNIPAEGAGVVQLIRNTADATFYGGELDATIVPVAGLVFTGSLGIVDAQYSNVVFDLNGDGMVNAADEDLTPPRLANITANISGLYDLQLGGAGTVTFRASYAYRDQTFFTDNNLGILPGGHVVDASIAYSLPDIDLGSTYLLPQISVYGRNLADEVFLGGQTPLPPALAPMTPPLGGNFSPLKEGRVIGAEIRVDWN